MFYVVMATGVWVNAIAIYPGGVRTALRNQSKKRLYVFDPKLKLHHRKRKWIVSPYVEQKALICVIRLV